MFLYISILAGFYFIYSCYQNDYVGINRVLLTVFMLAYATLYVFVPPFLGMANQYAGRAFELFPVGCYFLAMLPDMDEASAEEKALVFLAWSGLVVMASFLVYFKLYVW
ncbi:TPA: hypothetical protein KD853_004620 [Vibrio parahaemolyticus]|nr:hypothetical protein [Vibrio parahaemolyticus]EGR0930768.1 hypothetical protein [Vibrio parahaemolyticus]EGR1737194.1 hypothetical protein [Vibrio parahaemolyticus]EGR3234455.1 hypothetical protein [Vibrio parahaemolyticus]EGX7687657.1 hypothetical protein [Vibrio parahaemolyticus]